MKNYCLLCVLIYTSILSGCGLGKVVTQIAILPVKLTTTFVDKVTGTTMTSKLDNTFDKNSHVLADSDTFSFDQKFGVIKDSRTGLMWRRCAVGRTWDSKIQTCTGDARQVTWFDMVETALEEKYAGFNDWRLPTGDEFKDLVDATLEDKRYSCTKIGEKIENLFPNIHSKHTEFYSSNYWLLDISDDMMNPSTVDMESSVDGIMNGFACHFIESVLRAHAKRPAILVRGGVVPTKWKVAVSTVPNSKTLISKSEKIGEENWASTKNLIGGTVSSVQSALKESMEYSNSPSSGGNYKYTVECTGTTFSGTPKKTYFGEVSADTLNEVQIIVNKLQKQHSCSDRFGARYSGSAEGYLRSLDKLPR
jgi:hypothetical protein